MIRRKALPKLLIAVLLSVIAISAPLAYFHGSGDPRLAPVSQHLAPQLHAAQRNLLQLGRPWIDNGGTWPAGFSDLDKATETQRIFKAVVAERNRTTYAARYPDKAWDNWLTRYNVTFNSTEEAAYRRQVFGQNLALAVKLNELAGPEVAFGINRFSVLTSQEFLASYTGDAQDDTGITVDAAHPATVNSPAAAVVAALRAAADAAAAAAEAAAANNTGNGTMNGNGTALTPPGNGTGGSGGTIVPLPPGGVTPPVSRTGPFWVGGSSGSSGSSSSSGRLPGGTSRAPVFAEAAGSNSAQPSSRPLPGALYSVNGGGHESSSGGIVGSDQAGGGRRLVLQQEEEEQEEPEEEEEEQWQLQFEEEEEQQHPGTWQRLLEALGWSSRQEQEQEQQQQQRQYLSYTIPAEHQLRQRASGGSSSAARRLQQVIQPAAPFQQTRTFCSKQVAFPYTRLLPFHTVDWLRGGAVRPPKMQNNCSNSFAFVAAALAEATMLMQGYNGSATDISPQQLLDCFPGGSCTRGGTVHVLLNYLACKGVAAVDSSLTGGTPGDGTYSRAGAPGTCANGTYQPVVTGITGWAWVPNNEFALGQALSRVPAKVSVDASILQLYRAGYIGCNAVSRVTNHAMLAVGYNNQVRVGPPVPGSGQNYTFFNGSEYWMLKNSWGDMGSVDGFVYVKKGCQTATPIGMMINRGVIPTWNQTESYNIGRLQCQNETNSNGNCTKDDLLRLAGFCAGVDDYLPTPVNQSCSCSCIPT